MTVEHLEVLVEEPSIEAALNRLLPRILPDMTFSVYVHRGKPDLLRAVPQRLKGYAHWLPANHRILVLVDRDDADCQQLKADLERMALAANLPTRANRRGDDYRVINRIAVPELEAWFFGDWPAVCAAYPNLPVNVPQRKTYRNPDAIRGGAWEALERVLQSAGYFQTGLRKIEAARAIAHHMQPEQNRSHSFQVFRQALLDLAVE